MSATRLRPAVGHLTRIGTATVLAGVGTGLAVLLLVWIVHSIEHLVWGEGRGPFLDGLAAPSEFWLPLVTVSAAGVIAAVGWYLIRRFGRPVASVEQGVDGRRMPVLETLVDTVLQVVSVALGASIGKEVAPRELAAMASSKVVGWFRLTPRWRRILIASAAGAGLAAVYNVPLGGAVFVLEVLLGTFDMRALVVAVVTSAIAAVVAWIGLGNEHQYAVPPFVLSAPLVAWSIVCGPLFGFAAYGFVRLTTRARADAPKGRLLPVLALINFAVIGVLAMRFPQLLGNGKGPASLGFDGSLTIGLAAALLVLKVLIEAGSLRAGAEGGLLTPGLANGALLGVVLGGLWSLVWPGASIGGCALIGAFACLVGTQ